MNNNNEPIEIQKNDYQKIIIEVREYEGQRYIDIRTHMRGDPRGEFQPSTKGCTVPLSKASELRRAIDRLFAENEFAEKD